MTLKTDIRKLAKQCVKCAVCAPACPTYVKTLNEGESARGRIALMDALASEELTTQQPLLNYLNSCLYCRSCEAVCPAEVKYADMLNLTHQLIAKNHPMPFFLNVLFKNLSLMRLLALILIIYQKTGMQKLVKIGGFFLPLSWQRLNNYLPKLALSVSKKKISTSSSSRSVYLFLGCIDRYTENSTLQAAIDLLEFSGWQVIMPKKQGCCGAFHLHCGSKTFETLAKNNIKQFNHGKKILFTSTGCGMILNNYPDPFFRQHLDDVPHFLFTHAFEHLKFLPLKKRIAVQIPCSLKNVLKTESAVISLLQKIPDATIIILKPKTSCCGAAGLNMFTHPKMADSLAQDVIDQILETNAEIVVTENSGCHIHLQAQLQEKNIAIDLINPLVLLSKLLITHP